MSIVTFSQASQRTKMCLVKYYFWHHRGSMFLNHTCCRIGRIELFALKYSRPYSMKWHFVGRQSVISIILFGANCVMNQAECLQIHHDLICALSLLASNYDTFYNMFALERFVANFSFGAAVFHSLRQLSSRHLEQLLNDKKTFTSRPSLSDIFISKSSDSHELQIVKDCGHSCKI